jgi:putative hydrolases of HD superfamily
LSLIQFFRTAGKLKSVRRQGWVDRGIPNPESVADHTFRAMVMAWVLGREAGLDVDRLLKLMLLHDLPEAEAGDATPYADALGRGGQLNDTVPHWRELVSPEQLAAARRLKRSAEEQAVQDLGATLPASLGDELADLWLDYTERRSPEARFAAQVDKLEAALQAVEYADAGHDADVANFLLSAKEVVDHPVLLGLLRELEGEARPGSATETHA